jgi:hypothetical protein
MDLFHRAIGAISYLAIGTVTIFLITVATAILTHDGEITGLVASILLPAWLTVELIRWLNRCADPRYTKRPTDPR